MIPRWLQRKIGDSSRAATLRLCPRCKSPVIVGLDDERAAINATCDPTPITQLGEAFALVQGRATYDLADDDRRKVLWHRYAWNIHADRRHPVLAAHKCGSPMAPFAAPTPEIRKAAVNDDANPPF